MVTRRAGNEFLRENNFAHSDPIHSEISSRQKKTEKSFSVTQNSRKTSQVQFTAQPMVYTHNNVEEKKQKKSLKRERQTCITQSRTAASRQFSPARTGYTHARANIYLYARARGDTPSRLSSQDKKIGFISARRARPREGAKVTGGDGGGRHEKKGERRRATKLESAASRGKPRKRARERVEQARERRQRRKKRAREDRVRARAVHAPRRGRNKEEVGGKRASGRGCRRRRRRRRRSDAARC